MNRALWFAVIATVEIAAQLFGLTTLHFISKPLLVPALLSIYFSQERPVKKIFIAALFFCWLGDVFLLMESSNPIFFMLGLGAFLVAHLLFIPAYRGLMSAEGAETGTARIRLAFPVVLAGTGLVVVLYPKLGDLRIPVILYALALTSMVLQSIFRLGRTSNQSFWLLFAGAVLFMVSDALLATNKFYQPLAYAGVFVMTTYIAALYLIVQGALAHGKPA